MFNFNRGTAVRNRTEAGGCIAGRGWAMSRCCDPRCSAIDLGSRGGSYPMVRFPNRIAKATLLGRERSIRWCATTGPNPTPSWRRLAKTLGDAGQRQRFRQLAYEHRRDAAGVRSTARRRCAARGTLELTLSSQPVQRARRPAWVASVFRETRPQPDFLPGNGRWEMGPDKLPTERRPHTGGRSMRLPRCRSLLRWRERHGAPSRRVAAHRMNWG